MSKQNTAKKLRLIFMGTPVFSVPILKALIEENDWEIVGVFTQADKAVGRGQVVSFPPIKQLAIENKLPIWQPLKIKESLETIKSLTPDLIIVAAYGKIIPTSILEIPTYSCLNVHASLLPKYRGAACLNAPILNGDSETGITIMKMEAGLDTGSILKQAKITLQGDETLEIVHDKLSSLGAKLLPQTIKDWVRGEIKETKQDETQASYVKTLTKEDGRIDWQKSALEIEHLIRAYNPWPGTYSFKDGALIKILTVDKTPLAINNYKVGEIFLNNNQLAVQCGQDSLVILKLQTAGKKAMASEEFLRGHKLEGVLG
jgi:methionyl-tRNA formyltransferase